MDIVEVLTYIRNKLIFIVSLSRVVNFPLYVFTRNCLLLMYNHVDGNQQQAGNRQYCQQLQKDWHTIKLLIREYWNVNQKKGAV